VVKTFTEWTNYRDWFKKAIATGFEPGSLTLDNIFRAWEMTNQWLDSAVGEAQQYAEQAQLAQEKEFLQTQQDEWEKYYNTQKAQYDKLLAEYKKLLEKHPPAAPLLPMNPPWSGNTGNFGVPQQSHSTPVAPRVPDLEPSHIQPT